MMSKNNPREFAQKVKELAALYDMPFFFVTDGASAYSNNGNEAIRQARKSHIAWEKRNGINPEHDWSKQTEEL